MLHVTKYEKFLFILFVLTLPLSNAWVRGDGVGYYAYARSMLFERRLDFTEDWLNANSTFRESRVDSAGHINPDQYTPTGHLDNHFSVGPAILWAPFLLAVRAGVGLVNALGGHAANDGYSTPYLVAMAFGTAFYGFLAIWISFRITRKYFLEHWAFVAAIGIWFATSLPVYMYFNPSWAHAHSAFVVALFLGYWDRTRGARTFTQWIVLGALGGLMADVYYPNAILFAFPALESLNIYWNTFNKKTNVEQPVSLILKNVLFLIFAILAFLPTLITKKVIYGGYLYSGYYVSWFLNSPAFFKVLISSDHGLLSWTPIVTLSIAGFAFLYRCDRALALYSIVSVLAYIYFLGCYSDWDGLSSFGNRFCISLTPLFILGLAAFFDGIAKAWQVRRAYLSSASLTALLILWNLGLIFQWGVHLIPARGAISWRAAAYNQVAIVPEEAGSTIRRYLTHRKALMNDIEERDVHTVDPAQPSGPE